MKKNDVMDVSNAYSYKHDLNKIKQELPKALKKHLEASPLAGLINNEEIANLCTKYNIEVQSWLKLATEVMNTQEMQVA